MRLQQLFALAGGDGLGELRREEAFQAREALVLQVLDAQQPPRCP